MTRKSIARLTVISALGVLGLTEARAQQPGAGAINFQELFLTLDANNDLMIARGEIPESARPAFDRLLKLGDKNGDGKLEREEYRDMLLRADSAQAGMAARLTAMDKDGDGKVSRQEFQGTTAMFDQIDTDKDGLLTKPEITAARPGMVNPAVIAQRIKSMDKNGDGKITREEFTGFAPNFDRVDANKDGVIEPEELSKFQSTQPTPPASPVKK